MSMQQQSHFCTSSYFKPTSNEFIVGIFENSIKKNGKIFSYFSNKKNQFNWTYSLKETFVPVSTIVLNCKVTY